MRMSGLPDEKALRIFLLAVMAAICALTLLGLAGLRINTTNSLPMGIYIITQDEHAPLVEFCPQGASSTLSSARGYRPPGFCPDGAVPLLKPVIACPGDTVALSAEAFVAWSSTQPAARTRLAAGRSRVARPRVVRLSIALPSRWVQMGADGGTWRA
jgi:type IV secretory pathway protease TraF